jgi:hypothetical protein
MALMEYDLVFIHRKGKYNAIADALSRLPSEMALQSVDSQADDSMTPLLVCMTRRGRKRGRAASLRDNLPDDSVASLESRELEEWKNAQREDVLCSQVLKYLQLGEWPDNDKDRGWIASQGHEFVIQQGLVCRVILVKEGRTTSATTRIVVPKSEVTKLVMGLHTAIAEGGQRESIRG